MKKIFFLLTVLLALLPLWGSAMEFSGPCGDSLSWVLDEYGHLVISGTGDMDDYTDRIHSSWGVDVTSVTVGEGVTSIGDYAFYECDVLTEVRLPSTLKDLGKCCFSKCTSLASIDLPVGLETLQYGAFSNCLAMKEITLPASVLSVSPEAFFTNWTETPVLMNIFVADGNPVYEDLDGILYERDSHILVRFPDGRSGAWQIPEGTTAVGRAAFLHSKIESVTLPEGVTSLGDFAFQECYDLADIHLPEGLTDIGFRAFSNVRADTVVLPRSVRSFGMFAFADSKTMTVIFLGKPDHIDPSAFGYTSDRRIRAWYDSADGWKRSDLKNYAGRILWVDYTGGTPPVPTPVPTPTPTAAPTATPTATPTLAPVPQSGEATLRVVWNDLDDRAGIRPQRLKVVLNGVAAVLSESCSWHVTLADLPPEIGAGWTVPTLPEGYRLSRSAPQGTVTTLTMTLLDERLPAGTDRDLRVRLVWTGLPDGEALPDLRADLYRLDPDGAPVHVRTVTVTEDQLRQTGGDLVLSGLKGTASYFLTLRPPAGYTLRYDNPGASALVLDRAVEGCTVTLHHLPRTGDPRSPALWAFLAAGAALGLWTMRACRIRFLSRGGRRTKTEN